MIVIKIMTMKMMMSGSNKKSNDTRHDCAQLTWLQMHGWMIGR